MSTNTAATAAPPAIKATNSKKNGGLLAMFTGLLPGTESPTASNAGTGAIAGASTTGGRRRKNKKTMKRRRHKMTRKMRKSKRTRRNC